MAKLIVITDPDGRVVGSIRADPIDTEIGTIQFSPPSQAALRRQSARFATDLTYHELEIPDEEFMARPVEDLHRELERRVSAPPSGPAHQQSGSKSPDERD